MDDGCALETACQRCAGLPPTLITTNGNPLTAWAPASQNTELTRPILTNSRYVESAVTIGGVTSAHRISALRSALAGMT